MSASTRSASSSGQPAIEVVSNVIDLNAGAAAASIREKGSVSGPSFFVLHSSTSLFAGVPHMAGKLDHDDPTKATFSSPQDIVVDKNQQLFVADTQNSRIRRINKAGRVSTIASISGGDGDITNWPHGLAFDHSGALYILQSGEHHHIYQISPTGTVAQLAGANEKGLKDVKGDLFKAQFNHPRATGVDSKNRLYICEKGNNAVRRIDLSDKSVTTMLDNRGKPLDLLEPEGIVVDQFDDIYVADTGHHRIMKLTPREANGVEWNDVANYCGAYGDPGYENGESSEARLNRPTGLAIDKQNHLWICDSGNNCVRMFSYRSELMFTISGKGSESQEKMYHNPTSIALTYDMQYGAEMAPTTPEEIASDPNHPLYYSYITPVVFIADSEAHCIKRIHTILLEQANALIDVMNNDPADDCPMHQALSYGETQRRDGLMKVLLELKPHLLLQKDKMDRLPLHIACMESSTPTAGSISLMDTIKPMLRLSQVDTIVDVDADGRTPLFYAMREMTLHSFNEANLGISATPANPSAASAYSRALISYLIMLSPSAVMHESCLNYTLHWLIFQGFPLKILKKYVQAYEDMTDSADGALANLSNPFLVRDQVGRLPLHVACMLQGVVGLDIIQWLVDSTAVSMEALKTRDAAILDAVRKADPTASAKNTPVPGHFPLFYACTNVIATDDPSGASSSGAANHTPLYKIPPTQVAIIEHLLHAWPEAILECEGAPIMHGSELPTEMSLVPKTVTGVTASITNTFLEWVFYLKGLRLLEIFLRKYPACIDNLAWQDSQDHGVAAVPGAPPNMLSMLHCSACIGDADLVELLLKAGANPFNQDTRGKLPIDYCQDAVCIALLKDYMSRDARRPKTPEPVSEYEVVETREMETQTASGDSVLESARAKLKNRESELQSEATRLAASQLAASKELELERMRLRDKEDALQRQAEADREEARQKSEATVLAKTLELAATRQRLAEELELERARLKAAAIETKRQAEATLEASRRKMEAELLASTEDAFKAEQERMKKEMAAEREALRTKQAELAASFEAERLASKKQLESLLTSQAEAKLAAEQRRLQEEVEVERLKLRERELELQRAAEHDQGMTRLRLEHEFAAKSQALATTSSKIAEELELERVALKQKEAELKRETEHERAVAKIKLEHDLRLASDAALAAEQKRLADHLEAENRRLLDREEAMTRELLQAKAQAKAQLESELASRADESSRALHARLAHEFEQAKLALQVREQQAQQRLESEREAERLRAQTELEAERRRLEAAVAEKMRELDRERLDAARRAEQLEEQARLARDAHATEASRSFQAQLAAERDKLAAAFASRARSQDLAMEDSLRQAKAEFEAQAAKAEEQVRAERAKLQADFDARQLKLDAEEKERLDRIAEEDAQRRHTFEADRARRIAMDAAEREQLGKASQNDRAEALRQDQERAARFAAAEKERAARWEAEEAQRLAMRTAEAGRFEAERLALLHEVEATKARLEAESAARAQLEQTSLESLRAKFEQEKHEHHRRLEAAFDAEKARLQALAHEDSRELLRKLDAEKKRDDALREEERRKDEARLAAERERLRSEADAKRLADEQRLAGDRARLEQERLVELERLDFERRRLEHERAEMHSKASLDAEARQAELAIRAAEEEVRDRARRQREDQEAEKQRASLEQREAQHRAALAKKEEQYRAKLAEREAALRAAEEQRLAEKASRIQALEEDVERTRRELELQIAEKHATRRGLHEKATKLNQVELALDAMTKAKAAAPAIRYTSNPLDVDPATLGADELPSVANSIAAFAKNFATMSFKSLLALLLSIPHSQLSKATILLRLYLSTHQGCAKKVDEASGLLPLHLAAQAGLYRELTDIVLKEHPTALKTEDRNGVYSIFYAAAFRKTREERAKKLVEDGVDNPLLHEDFRPETVRRYGLELVKYFMLKFPDSVYLPNTLRPPPENGEASVNGLISAAQIDEYSSHSLSVVEYAIEEQDLDLLTLLFELTAGDFLNAVDSSGRSYLHRAAQAGKLPLVQWLVEIGRQNPWTLCNVDKTPLEYVDAAKHDDVALYLTREMTKVPPELRVKQRRGGRRMLIREWSEEDGAPIASRFIGGRDSFLPSPVAGHLIEGASLDDLLDSALNSAANTPRGQLRPVMRTKSQINGGGTREEYDLVSTAEPIGKATHTTHIHVYPSLGGAGVNGTRSLPALKAGSPSAKSPSKFGFSSPKSRKSMDEAEAEYAALESYSAAHVSPKRSPTRSQQLHGYHWEFLPNEGRSKSQLVTHSAARRLGPQSPPARSPTGLSRTAEQFVTHPQHPSNSVEHTIYSLQATTSNLHQLLSDLHSPAKSPARKASAYRR